MAKSQKAIVVAPSEEALASLKADFPAESGFDRIQLPRLGFVSQDKMEGEGKNKHCVLEAGTFYTEVESEEKNEEGKSVWTKNEIGKEIEGTIIFSRKQLKYYDAASETFTSSNIYDSDEELVTLFSDGVKFCEDTVQGLKARYQFTGEDGKLKSKLEDNKILYILYNGELHQLNLRGSSMYSFKTFARKTTLIPAQLTKLSSEARVKGQISWNQMSFEKIRDLSADEVAVVQEHVAEIKNSIASEKAYYAKQKENVGKQIEYPAIEESNKFADCIAF